MVCFLFYVCLLIIVAVGTTDDNCSRLPKFYAGKMLVVCEIIYNFAET